VLEAARVRALQAGLDNDEQPTPLRGLAPGSSTPPASLAARLI
jgi:hypothetical protein